jgi:pimeloyl-ACP methyl ester carboxylesterase
MQIPVAPIPRPLYFIPPLYPLLAAVAGGHHFLNVPAKTSPKGDYSRRRMELGAHEVTHDHFRLTDRVRNTPAYGSFEGLPYRKLVCDLWRPRRIDKPRPLLLYSHGFMSSRREATYLLKFLASQGISAVALDFPLTGGSAPDGPHFSDIINQPGDISFVIDHLLARNMDSGDALYGTIDPDKIAVAGVSLGSMTTMLTTFHRDLRDTRVSASICIGGPTSSFGPKFYGNNKVPTLLVYGECDSLVPYPEHASQARACIANATLVSLRKASHAGFTEPASTYLRFLKNPDSLACRIMAMSQGGDSWSDTDYIDLLGGARCGITSGGDLSPPPRPVTRVAMKAARQQMFTTLAVHAFLESIFADDPARRAAARAYLTRTLPTENRDEVSVVT